MNNFSVINQDSKYIIDSDLVIEAVKAYRKNKTSFNYKDDIFSIISSKTDENGRTIIEIMV